jgi:hypothetical protein
MASSAAFDAAQQVLESSAGMDRWAARGAIQLALMDAGLEAGSVTVAEMEVVVDQLLAKQLESQKVVGVAGVCEKIRAALGLVGNVPGKDTPDRIFQRLGRGGVR